MEHSFGSLYFFLESVVACCEFCIAWFGRGTRILQHTLGSIYGRCFVFFKKQKRIVWKILWCAKRYYQSTTSQHQIWRLYTRANISRNFFLGISHSSQFHTIGQKSCSMCSTCSKKCTKASSFAHSMWWYEYRKTTRCLCSFPFAMDIPVYINFIHAIILCKARMVVGDVFHDDKWIWFYRRCEEKCLQPC